MQRFILLIVVVGVLPALGETYKSPFSIACGELWPAVKATLADQDHYAKVIINDQTMKADFQPKHTVHVDITGTLLQRMNHVKLVPMGSGCEMDVVSNYSGWGHDDQGDFRKRVDDNLTRAGNKVEGAGNKEGATTAVEAGKPAETAPMAEPAKPATGTEPAQPQRDRKQGTPPCSVGFRYSSAW